MGRDLRAGSLRGPGDIWCHRRHGCAMGMSPQANGTGVVALGWR